MAYWYLKKFASIKISNFYDIYIIEEHNQNKLLSKLIKRGLPSTLF